jgi:dihydrofolate reductase
MKLSIIVAMDDNQLIGKDNALPWRLPADLALGDVEPINAW